jgi:uncharacterized membrane protein (UPF0127 family)
MMCVLEFRPSGTMLTVEVVSSLTEIRRGLAFRRALPADEGMLFCMPREEPQVFWMKGVSIPLDLLFVNSQCTIVGLLENVPLPPPLLLWGIDEPSRWVIEVNAGWCKRHNVKAGDEVFTAKLDGGVSGSG